MNNPPRVRFPYAKAEEVGKSAETLLIESFYGAISSLESEVSDKYTPGSIRSTFQLAGLETSPEHPLPEVLARYHEVGAIKDVQIHFDASIDTHSIFADISIATSADTVRTINIGPSDEHDKTYTMTENGEPLDGNMSQSDIEDVLLSVLLPPHTRKLLEAQRVYSGGSKLDLESPKTFYLLSQVLRSRCKSAIELREYALPATALSTPSKMEVVETDDNKEIFFFSGSTFIDKDDGVDEIKFTVSTIHDTDLDIYGEINVTNVEMMHNGSILNADQPLSDSTKTGIIAFATKIIGEVKQALL